jgi:hypothetical protein
MPPCSRRTCTRPEALHVQNHFVARWKHLAKIPRLMLKFFVLNKAVLSTKTVHKYSNCAAHRCRARY